MCLLRVAMVKFNYLDICFVYLSIFSVFFSVQTLRAESQVVLEEDFTSLQEWEPLLFKKIAQHTTYEIVQIDSENHALKASSKSSASGLLSKKVFDVFKNPQLSWRWKVENIYQKGNAKRKDGDDFPLRIYVLFEYDPELASTWKAIKYRAAKAAYGEYPPHSTLNYIWANQSHEQQILTNPYTDSAQMLIMQAGSANINKWLTETVNILDDYRRAFGSEPPRKARLAIMNDSDNSGESSISYLDEIRVW